jgi:organic hydroperoxide reductase OsmC/OhrA
MPGREHRYQVDLVWTGNRGSGTSGYRAYDRSHDVSVPGSDKPALSCSSDPSFRGDPTRWNPEELLVASLSACHQLWYLHLCAEAGVIVTEYLDHATGLMAEAPDGGGVFLGVTLHPVVSVTRDSNAAEALALHDRAHALCFIANSVNFPVAHEPQIVGPEVPKY